MSQMGIRIPKDRIAVLIGVKGEVKDKLEKLSGCKIEVDSEEGDIIFSGDDSVRLMDLKNVVTAIGRGFNPLTAEKLFKEDFMLAVVNILDFTGKSKKKMLRMKGRVIGRDGKARKMIENLTDVEICVQGKTLSIIGTHDNVDAAKRACEDLLSGAPHGNVFLSLERRKKQKMKF